jgi:hypothetical protein
MKSFLGALSVGSGLALAAAPQPMAGLFGLPRRSLLARGLGVRDLAIGLRLLDHDRSSGLAARAVSDLLDAGLIWRERRHRTSSLWNAGRLTVAFLSAGLAVGLRFSARAERRRGLLQDAQSFLRRQPALALGGAFLLGVTAARSVPRRRDQRPDRALAPGAASTGNTDNTGSTRAEPQPQRPERAGQAVRDFEAAVPHDAGEPEARETPETTRVGSPIGDSPYAGGSRY